MFAPLRKVIFVNNLNVGKLENCLFNEKGKV